MQSAAPCQNKMLAALPSRDLERLYPDLELIFLPLGKVLHESGDALNYVYFPTTAIVSLIYLMEDGGSAEVAVTGNDGVAVHAWHCRAGHVTGTDP